MQTYAVSTPVGVRYVKAAEYNVNNGFLCFYDEEAEAGDEAFFCIAPGSWHSVLDMSYEAALSTEKDPAPPDEGPGQV